MEYYFAAPVTPEVEIVTYMDLVQRLLLNRGLSESPREVKQLQTAVLNAMGVLPTRAEWRHYLRRFNFTTSAQVGGFRAVYDHTGGTHERQLTIVNSEVWPADAAFGEVRIADKVYDVERRVSDTVLTLRIQTNPGNDVAELDVVWQRPSYYVPPIRHIHRLWKADSSQPMLKYVTPVEFGDSARWHSHPGEPLFYTIQGTSLSYGVQELRLCPPPQISEVYECYATVKPWPLSVYDKNGVNGAGAVGTNTFTSSDANFKPELNGCLLRVSPSATLPSGFGGLYSGRVEYSWQTIIRRVVNGTTLETVDAIPEEMTSRGYSISSVADVDTGAMLTYLDAVANEEFCKNFSVEDTRKAAEYAMVALKDAMRAENVTDRNQSTSWTLDRLGSYRLKDYAMIDRTGMY